MKKENPCGKMIGNKKQHVVVKCSGNVVVTTEMFSKERITQEASHRQRALKWAEKHGVTAASIRYKVSRKTIYKWKKRYNGNVGSLKEHKRTPHRIARKQTADELKPVKRYAGKYAGDLLLGFEKAKGYGYTRS